jgi:hypothetical protein
MKISYLRPVRHQPGRLEVLASSAYTTHVIAILRKHRHTFADAVCLRLLRRALGDHLTGAVARTVREELFRYGCHVLQQKEAAWSAVRDFQAVFRIRKIRFFFTYDADKLAFGAFWSDPDPRLKKITNTFCVC